MARRRETRAPGGVLRFALAEPAPGQEFDQVSGVVAEPLSRSDVARSASRGFATESPFVLSDRRISLPLIRTRANNPPDGT